MADDEKISTDQRLINSPLLLNNRARYLNIFKCKLHVPFQFIYPIMSAIPCVHICFMLVGVVLR